MSSFAACFVSSARCSFFVSASSLGFVFGVPSEALALATAVPLSLFVLEAVVVVVVVGVLPTPVPAPSIAFVRSVVSVISLSVFACAVPCSVSFPFSAAAALTSSTCPAGAAGTAGAAAAGIAAGGSLPSCLFLVSPLGASEDAAFVAGVCAFVSFAVEALEGREDVFGVGGGGRLSSFAGG